MGDSRRFLLSLSLLALFVLGCASLSTGDAAQDNGTVVVTGRLMHVVAIGSETTGLALRLDSTLTLGGKVYHKIELDSKGVDVSPLFGKHVEVIGRLVYKKGVERGAYPALELIGIRRLE